MHITIIGFGNQARAWSQNLRDSGVNVRVALRPQSPSIGQAKALGFETVMIPSKEFFSSRHFALLTPDQGHDGFLREHASSFRPGSVILYAHGYSLTKHGFEKTYPALTHVLFAPKAIGSELRKQFVERGKLGAVYSLEHVGADREETRLWLRDLATNLGINLGPYETSFKRETEADLFSEQGLLCSLIPYTAEEMFRNLTDAGVEPELAYFECWHELKLIINAMVETGPQGFFDLISPNALVGAEKGYRRLMGAEFRANLSSLLREIKSGEFDRELGRTPVEDLRATIKSRWEKTLLMKTFTQINRDAK